MIMFESVQGFPNVIMDHASGIMNLEGSILGHVIVVVFVTLCSFAFWLWSVAAPRVKNIPGPPAKPFYGHVSLMRKNYARMYDFIVELGEKYGQDGAFQLAMPGRNPLVFLTDPRNIEHVMTKNFSNYLKFGPDFPEAKRVGGEFFGHGIFAVDGSEWRRQRKLYSYMFSDKMLREKMFNKFEGLFDDLSDRISEYAEEGVGFNIQKLFCCLTIEGICQIAFGQEFGCIRNKNTPAFVHAFDLSQERVPARHFDLFWRVKRFFNVGVERKFAQQMSILDDFVSDLITKTRQADPKTLPFNILSLALERISASGENVTDQELRDIVMSFCIAGRDTTACMMTWTIYELCSHPEVYAKVVEEVDSLDNLDFVNIDRNLPYLKSVLLETLRLHPSVPSDQKRALKADVLPTGHKIGPAYILNLHPYMAGRNKKVWGEDASEFRPERFADGDKQYGDCKYPAFNAGPRLCLGKPMALLEGKYIIASLLRSFELKLVPEKLPVTYVLSILLWAKGGMWVTAKPRQV
eukprot:532680_1